VTDDNPPEGFRRIDFDRGGEITFNGHVGNLYARKGAKGTRDEFVMGLRVQRHMCNPAGGLHGGMMMTMADLVGSMGGTTIIGLRKFVPTVSMTFDFVAHQLLFQTSDGVTKTLPLEPITVAEFHERVMAVMRDLGVQVHIWTMPVEIPDPIRFEKDVTHHSYDRDAANAFWRALLAMKPVFEHFRCAFIGKCSPIHFFWGGFDLAVTRFNGKRAPERPGANSIDREAYSHEVISHGFWPGRMPALDASFYAYAAPEPPGLKEAKVQPGAAYYDKGWSEFFLPYEAVRTARNPADELTAFLNTTYEAAASLAGWTRAELERR